MNNTKSAVVIGAGFGGLALAIRLQASGIPTTLLEQRDKPGGRAYVYEDQGFTFDAGPTVITDPSALEELFAVAGKKMSDYVEMLPVAPFYRLCWEDGTFFDYANDQEALDRQIHALNPADVAGYQRFLDYGCASCHQGAGVGGNMFQRFGVMDSYLKDDAGRQADLGRFNVSGLDKDKKPKDQLWFDVSRLKVLSDTPVMQLPNFDFGPQAEGRQGAAEKPASFKA